MNKLENHWHGSVTQITSALTRVKPSVPAVAAKQNIAAQEGRSMAQICEAFLRAGSEVYKKEGSKFLHRWSDRRSSCGLPVSLAVQSDRSANWAEITEMAKRAGESNRNSPAPMGPGQLSESSQSDGETKYRVVRETSPRKKPGESTAPSPVDTNRAEDSSDLAMRSSQQDIPTMDRGHPHTIKLRLWEMNQLFDSMDPSPFIERNLDDDAEEFIVSWAQEFSCNVPIRCVSTWTNGLSKIQKN